MKNKRLFIVEDSPVAAADMKRILKGLGYEVAGIAGDGAEAIARCAAAAPDLVLMDVRLPGAMNGIEAAAAIGERIRVPVVYMSAYSDREIIEEIQHSCPYGFIVKPFREKDILVAIETALTRFEYERKLEASERLYRSLFEGTSDIIFTMDENLRVLSVNWAVMNQLNLRPEEIISRPFLDLLNASPGFGGVSCEIVREKIDFFMKNRRPIGFRASFQSNFNREPVEMNVRMECVTSGDERIIIARACRIIEDELLKFFVKEKQSLVMGNQLFLVGDVAYRLTRNLRRYCEQDTVDLARMALIEMIVNAIEHGNLEISYDEKLAAMKSGDYVTFVSERQADPRYRDRQVRIDFEIAPPQAIYSIEDDGRGFDHRAFLVRDADEMGGGLRPSGRGILMTTKIFDEVTFNERGNRVTLVKRFTTS